MIGRSLRALRLATLLILALPTSAAAIVSHQIDDFEDESVMGWVEGAVSPDMPTNEEGGPAGPDDNYIENVSTGVFGPGANLVMFNTSQWAGDYTAANVAGISMDLANFGDVPLHMRIAVRRSSTWYASNDAFELPADGMWHFAAFGLTNADMTGVQGGTPLSDVLLDVGEIRLLSAELGPNFRGDTVEARQGTDNIRALLVGDTDCDGDVDFDDIDAFVLGLTSPPAYEAQFGLRPSLKGDTDRDGDQDFDDIPGLVDILTGNIIGVPEPAAIWLLCWGLGWLTIAARIR